jgi:RNA polymerase sigma factor (sigma-70 family)
MDEPRSFLDHITTRWPLISDPVRFVMRYAPAIRRYMSALVKDPHDLDDVTQEFLLGVVKRGFAPEHEVRGRFRDYLKGAIRNAALTHLRKRRPAQASDIDLAALATGEDTEREWVEEWRGTMLSQALAKLEDHERRSPDGRLHTVLTLARDHPDADSPTLAGMCAARTGKPMSPEAFRKQLSRARALLANLLVDEVRGTLEDPTQDLIDDELAALGLQELVGPYLSE